MAFHPWTSKSCGWLAAFFIAGSLAGCSPRSTLEVRPRASLTAETGLAGLVLRVGAQEIRVQDYRPDPAGLTEAFLEVPNSGRLVVEMELHQDGQVVAAGSFSFQLRSNFAWAMDVFRQASDPSLSCFGCAGSERFAIDAALQNEPGERLWFTWGGLPRGSDAVF